MLYVDIICVFMRRASTFSEKNLLLTLMRLYMVLVVSEQLVHYWALGLGYPIFHNIERWSLCTCRGNRRDRGTIADHP